MYLSYGIVIVRVVTFGTFSESMFSVAFIASSLLVV